MHKDGCAGLCKVRISDAVLQAGGKQTAHDISTRQKKAALK